MESARWATDAALPAAEAALSAATLSPPSQVELRARIGLLCHLIRAATIGWIGWTLLVTIWAWSDREKLLGNLGHYLNADLSGITQAEYVWASVVGISACTPVVAVGYCIWRLFGTYLDGRIFTVDAAAWMRRVGIAGLVAVLVDIVFRRIIWWILTSHGNIPLGTRLYTQVVIPNDLLYIVFCLFVIAIAHIFKTAAEIADDNARIV
jgi:hypothetical protein